MRFKRKFLKDHLTNECKFEPVNCDKICGLALPRGEFSGHDCAKQLKTVYTRILEENKIIKDSEMILKEENKRLL